MYDTLLLPTDGSQATELALPQVRGLAELYNSTVHVLFVADTDRDSLSVISGEVFDALEQEGREVVDELVERLAAHGIDTTGAVVRGAPAQAIVDYVESNGIDLVVMATHGRGRVERLLLGSVTEQVVRTAPAPVLTVRASE